MTLKAIALSLAITVTAVTAVFALNNRIALDREMSEICVFAYDTTDDLSPLDATACPAR
ncbi:hypothetical protein [Litoreibacter janthinus]|uniref:Uncharacterized protein n=1 Tax=Litoreibacter janthinus TaxID=670154 RepID=A0A1I6HQR7_9RHOB|nr:hypothetical protein [Litoreibacter janthinus]SFR56724.1 hypothetical protein SAMN04488002_3270 [Litoreibacter janthinus]